MNMKLIIITIALLLAACAEPHGTAYQLLDGWGPPELADVPGEEWSDDESWEADVAATYPNDMIDDEAWVEFNDLRVAGRVSGWIGCRKCSHESGVNCYTCVHGGVNNGVPYHYSYSNCPKPGGFVPAPPVSYGSENGWTCGRARGFGFVGWE